MSSGSSKPPPPTPRTGIRSCGEEGGDLVGSRSAYRSGSSKTPTPIVNGSSKGWVGRPGSDLVGSSRIYNLSPIPKGWSTSPSLPPPPSPSLPLHSLRRHIPLPPPPSTSLLLPPSIPVPPGCQGPARGPACDWRGGHLGPGPEREHDVAPRMGGGRPIRDEPAHPGGGAREGTQKGGVNGVGGRGVDG